MAPVVGFAFLELAVTPVGKLVFLLGVSTIPNAMRCMTTTAGMVQKAAVGRKKKAAVGGTKTIVCVIPYYMVLPIGNKVIFFLYRRSRTFFTAKGGLFVFAAFQPATRQARMGVAGNIRELALEISPDTHGRIGQSPKSHKSFCSFLR